MSPAPGSFAPGAGVRVRDDWPEARGPAHIRTPHYVRGRVGRIVRALGAFPNPEDLAFARQADRRALYHVAFPQTALWPDGAADAEVVVEIFEHWLEPAPSMRVAAVIPVWEEEGSIGPVVSAVPRALVPDVFVVDGGSRDGTREAARAAGAQVVAQRARGYGAACFEGAAAARAAGAEVVVFLDGDGTDKPEAMSGLLAPILAGTHDFVIGSRTRGARELGAMGPHQVWAGRALGAAIGLLYGTRYTDMAAFRAIRLDCLERLDMREMTYGWNLEMQMRAARAKLRILELPVPSARRTAGRSKVAGTVRGTVKASWRILATFARIAAAG